MENKKSIGLPGGPNEFLKEITQHISVEGYKRYSDRGRFKPPESCVMAKEEWLCEANNVLRFVKERIKIFKDKSTLMCSASEVHRHYEDWCLSNGVNAKSRNNFYKDLVNAGLIKRPGGGNKTLFYGGELLEGFDDFDDFDQL